MYGASLATINFFRTPQIGYINSSVLLQKYDGFIEARKQIQKETGESQRNVQTLEGELKELGQELMTQGGEWENELVRSKQEEIAKKQDEYLRYSRAVTDKTAKLEKELTEPVLLELNSLITRFGKERGQDVIFGTVAGGNILYAKDTTDLTDEFLIFANTKN